MPNYFNFLSHLQASILSNRYYILNNNNIIGQTMLYLLTLLDVYYYNKDRLNFGINRRKNIGSVFCSLGRVICVDYPTCLQGIQKSQSRGPYIGRLKFNHNLFPKNFPIYMSDSHQHKTIHNLLVNIFNHNGQSTRLTDAYSESMITDLCKNLNNSKILKKNITINGSSTIDFEFNIVEKFLHKYLYYVLLGIKLTEEQVTELENILSPTKNNGQPLYLANKFMNKNEENIKIEKKFTQIISRSLDIKTDLNNEEVGELVFFVVSIAGYLGILNSLAAILSTEIRRETFSSTRFPNITDQTSHTKFILEVIRKTGPVNLINTKLEKNKTIIIAEKEYDFPKGTVLTYSLFWSGLDASFPSDEPDKFSFQRSNLEEISLNFNSVGLGEHLMNNRSCPGRFIAIKMLSKILTGLTKIYD